SRVLFPAAVPRGLLPASAAADRRAEKGAAGCLASDRPPASEVRLDSTLYRPLGVQGRRHAGRRGTGIDRLSEGLRDAARIRLSPSVAGRRCAAMGQPLCAALRNAVRRREIPAADAAHDDRRRSAADGGPGGLSSGASARLASLCVGPFVVSPSTSSEQ